MVVKCNQFIDDDNLTDKSSLIHLLDRHTADYCDEIPLLKHSPFYSENQFTNLLKTNNGLCILDMNIANAFINLTIWKLLLIGLIKIIQLVLYA